MAHYRQQVRRRDAEADVGGEDAAGDRGEAVGHDGVQLRVGQVGQVGLDHEGGLALTEKDVAGSRQRLAGSRADGNLRERKRKR